MWFTASGVRFVGLDFSESESKTRARKIAEGKQKESRHSKQKAGWISENPKSS